MPDPAREELMKLTGELLDCIAARDWTTYERLCDASLTAFEPEAQGHLVAGLPFHRYYFQLGGGMAKSQETLCQAQVRVLGDVGIVTYVRLTQKLGDDGRPVTVAANETRIWHKQPSGWKLVHFHRSGASS
jgi:ketosteroid isomerase-like protein